MQKASILTPQGIFILVISLYALHDKNRFWLKCLPSSAVLCMPCLMAYGFAIYPYKSNGKYRYNLRYNYLRYTFQYALIKGWAKASLQKTVNVHSAQGEHPYKMLKMTYISGTHCTATLCGNSLMYGRLTGNNRDNKRRAYNV